VCVCVFGEKRSCSQRESWDYLILMSSSFSFISRLCAARGVVWFRSEFIAACELQLGASWAENPKITRITMEVKKNVETLLMLTQNIPTSGILFFGFF
jgi:hypothetical protein